MISISCEIFHRCISYIILTYIYFYIHTKAHKVTRAPQCSFASLAKHPFNKYEKILPTSTITVYGWILSLQPRCKIATLYRQVLYVPKYFLCVPYYFLYPLRTILLHNLGGVLQLIWVFVRGCLADCQIESLPLLVQWWQYVSHEREGIVEAFAWSLVSFLICIYTYIYRY